MSKCKQCGSKNGKNEIFCGNCGAAMGVTAAAAAPQKSISKKLLIGGGVLAVVILAVVLVLVLMPQKPQTISLDKYVTVEFSGYSTLGEATLQVDWKELKDDLTEDMEAEEKREIKRLLDKDRLVLKLDKYTDLANGDTVTVKMTVDEEAFEELGFCFRLEKTEFTVEGLEEVNFINPFDYLKITYTGCAPNAKVVLENTTEDSILQNYLSFRCENGYSLDEGDTFTVRCRFDGPAEQMGYFITQTEKEFVATNVPQPQEFDPFEYLDVTFSGIDGAGKLTYQERETEHEMMKYIRFSFSRNSYLYMGDKVTCTVSCSVDSEEYGYKITATEKIFEVSGLSTYAKSFDDFSEDEKAQLIEYALSTLEEKYKDGGPGAYLYASTSWGDMYALNTFASYENIQLAYTYSAQDREWSWDDPYWDIGIIITFELDGHRNAELNGTVYAQASYRRLVLDADGHLADGWQNKLKLGVYAYSTYEVLEVRYLNAMEDYTVAEA